MAKLSIKQIDALPAARKRVCFGDRLWLNVTATGAKQWFFRWRDQNLTSVLMSGKNAGKIVGMVREAGLGSYPAITPDAARLLANQMTNDIFVKGLDPIKEREQNRIDSVVSTYTFRDALTKLIAQRTKTRWKANGDKKLNTRDTWERFFENHLPDMLDMPARKITDDVAVSMMEQVFEKSVSIYDQMITRAEDVMEIAIAKSGQHRPNPFRYEGHLSVLVGERKVTNVVVGDTNVASLPYAEAPALVEKLRARKAITGKAILMTMLTGARTDEVRCMRVSEIDWENKVWNVPADRTKKLREHFVPLSDEAIDLLKSVIVEGNEFVFSATGGKPLEERALNKMLTGPAKKGYLAYAGTATVHGMRTTLSTWAQAQNRWHDTAIKLAIAHVSMNKSDRAYLRHEYWAERVVMMQAYADHLFGKTSDNVVTFPQKEAA